MYRYPGATLPSIIIQVRVVVGKLISTKYIVYFREPGINWRGLYAIVNLQRGGMFRFKEILNTSTRFTFDFSPTHPLLSLRILVASGYSSAGQLPF